MSEEIRRRRFLVSGRVQGVGFRPFVYRAAVAGRLSGFVRNTPDGVVIEVEGKDLEVARFTDGICGSAPARAAVAAVSAQDIPRTGETGFHVVPSSRSGDVTVGMPPDFATCRECVSELFDPSDRRFGYPFINCTNCGPRFTIMRELPYDRERTTMASFAMCEACAAEYGNPSDRRFDAQPVACAACGPRVRLTDAANKPFDGDPIAKAKGILAAGGILAVKGIGGYHLCCSAVSDRAVRVLRERKKRPAKALAVMFDSLAQVGEYCEINDEERRMLAMPAAPIVILARREPCGLSALISPDTVDVGAFLPYTPLHHLLLENDGPFVMTSGNFADEPIAADEDELERIMGRIADCALTHNRPIARRCDDSVVKIANGKSLFLRRSRGYVPDSVKLAGAGPVVLGCGGDMKNTFCVTRQDRAFVSQHIGDLRDYRSYEFFSRATRDMIGLLGVVPEIVACDLHPDYRSTRWASEYGAGRMERVQHHHAHIVACMVENRIAGEVIGMAFDGTGMGEDGTIWGGEFLVADLANYRRVFSVKEYLLPGGDEAISDPRRMALSCLSVDTAMNEADMLRFLQGLDSTTVGVLRNMLAGRLHCPPASSIGRLFDAVSVILGFCGAVSYEGQAAIRLQDAALDAPPEREYPFETNGRILDFGPTIRAIVDDVDAGRDRRRIAAAFHKTVAEAAAAVCGQIRAETGLTRVALSGGVFQNHLLLNLLTGRLREMSFDVYSHSMFPPNDGCLSLGQAAIASARAGARL